MSNSRTMFFEVDHAKKYGVDAACLLFHLRYWIEINHIEERNEHDGRTWTYQSQKAILAHFPWISKGTLCRTLDILCSENGPMIKGNYNKNKYDRTVWYAFKNQAEWIRESYRQTPDIPQNEDMHSPDCENRCPNSDHGDSHNGATIPDLKTPYTKPTKEGGRFSRIPKEFSQEAKELAKFLLDKRDVLYPNSKPPNLEDWGEEIDRLGRIDKKSWSQIREMIEWAYGDKFWKQVILSATNLRQNWDKMYAQKVNVIKPQVNDVEGFMAALAERFDSDPEIAISSEGVAFTYGQNYFMIKLSEHGFKEQVINKLRKMGRNVSGL